MSNDKFLTLDQIKPNTEWKSRDGMVVKINSISNGNVSYVSNTGSSRTMDHFSFQCMYIPVTEKK